MLIMHDAKHSINIWLICLTGSNLMVIGIKLFKFITLKSDLSFFYVKEVTVALLLIILLQ